MGSSYPFLGINRSQMRAILAARLQDSKCIYWSIDELNSNLAEALRVFNAFTGYWRQRIPIALNPRINFYDLSPALTLPGYSSTRTVSDIQYSLLEPATGTSWEGTDQFTYSQVVAAVQSRHDQFLLETGIRCNYYLSPFSSPPIARSTLPQGTIDVRRAAWRNGLFYPLSREDERTAIGFRYNYNNSPTTFPTIYSLSTTPPLEIQLSPPPANGGELEMVLVSTGPALSPANGSLLSVPDDFSWAVKWGTLATLLSTDGQSRDFTRASYCRDRYTQAVAAAHISPSVLSVQVGGKYVSVDSLASLDGFSPYWQNAPPGPPMTIGMAGRNLLAVSPTPDRIYVATVDTVTNIPVPAFDGDMIQVGPECYTAILDYAHHISCFKMGGKEFSQTLPLYESFLALCTSFNGRLAAIAGDRNDLDAPATLQESTLQRVRT